MFNKSKVIFFALSLIGFANTVHAADLVCSGEVKHVAYHANSRLMVQLSSMNVPVFFCNPDSEWSVSGTNYKTSPESCKALYSTLLAARASKQVVDRMHFDGDDVPASCDAWEGWKNANIRFLRF